MKLLKIIALLLCLNAPIHAVFPDIPEEQRIDYLILASLGTGCSLLYSGLVDSNEADLQGARLKDLNLRPHDTKTPRKLATRRAKRDVACISATLKITAGAMLTIPPLLYLILQ